MSRSADALRRRRVRSTDLWWSLKSITARRLKYATRLSVRGLKRCWPPCLRRSARPGSSLSGDLTPEEIAPRWRNPWPRQESLAARSEAAAGQGHTHLQEYIRNKKEYIRGV